MVSVISFQCIPSFLSALQSLFSSHLPFFLSFLSPPLPPFYLPYPSLPLPLSLPHLLYLSLPCNLSLINLNSLPLIFSPPLLSLPPSLYFLPYFLSPYLYYTNAFVLTYPHLPTQPTLPSLFCRRS